MTAHRDSRRRAPRHRGAGAARLWWWLCWLGLVFARDAAAQTPDVPGSPLTGIRAIRALSPEDARREHAVRIRGTVTYINEREPAGIIIHEGTAGVFVRYGRTFLTAPTVLLRPGDVIEVDGFTTAEGFAPDVQPQEVRRLGRAALPRPQHLSYAALSGGGFDCAYIEVVGVGRRAWLSESGKTLFVDIAVEGGTIRAWFWDFAPEDVRRFIDARIRLRGNAGTLYTPARQVRGISLFAGRTADAVLETSAPDPWTLPIRAIGSIYTHQAMDQINRRVRLRGTVTATREGQPVLVEDITMHSRSRDVRHKIYVRDDTSAALIETEESMGLKPGDIIEAAGFPIVSSTKPRLQNAAIRRVGEGALPAPAVVTGGLSALADHDAELVQVEASLLADVATPAGRSFVLKSGDTVFEANLDPAVAVSPKTIPGGSRVSVRGVYAYDAGPPPAFHLLLRSDADIVLLAIAPWWTPRHSLVLLIVMGVSGLLGLAWARTVANRNAMVNERYCAIIAERSRLAAELHDTLEQGLAGIQLQLGAVSRSLDSSPPTARRALGTATEMLRYSISEARRSVMDLRHGALENRDLAGALTDVAERMTEGTPLTARVRSSGASRPLDRSDEHHLLRIGLEALTNTIKHSQATRVDVELGFGDALVELVVKDNGSGLPVTGIDDGRGHFGLRGIRERVDRLGGTLTLRNDPAGGAIVAVTVPLKASRVRTHDGAHS
jgi:two-component sensor histidine kinase